MVRLDVLREIITARSPLDMASLARRMSLSRSTIGGLFRRLDADDYAYQIVAAADLARDRDAVGICVRSTDCARGSRVAASGR